MTIRLVIVDDHAMVRAGVAAGLPPDIEVAGEADDVESAVQVIGQTRPDVVLLDVHLPGGNASAVLMGCADLMAHTRFLALSVSDAAEDVIGVVRQGARGYVTKSISPAELADAIRRVATGDAVFSPRLAGFVLDAFRDAQGQVGEVSGTVAGGARVAVPGEVSELDMEAGSARGPGEANTASSAASTDAELNRLTARERDVMRLIARGYTYREVASELFVSVKTVETHMSAVLRKLQLSNRRELTRWAQGRDYV